MILNKVDIQLDKFKVTDVFSPFGPLMMKGSLEEPVREKTLNTVKKLLHTDDPSDKVVHGGYSEGQDVTIKKGKFKSMDNSYPDIIQLVHDICHEYYSCVCFNIAQVRPEIWEKFDNSNRVITSIWSVLMKEGDFHISHDHLMEGAMLSGGIYLDVPTTIQPPEGDINWTLSTPGIEFRTNLHKHTPITGDWLVWPAWLQHHVYPFRGEGERIMISFNARLDLKKNNDE